MDHFVHRFTHRVVRGLLIAVGRPDGRLCCLSKSEAAVLLSAKQVRTLHAMGGEMYETFQLNSSD